jgi:hypothetical protein
VGIWPLLRAVPQRALLLLRTLLCAGAPSATRERANKRMSHLAGVSREATERLTTTSEWRPVRAHTPCWLKGLCALTGGLS